jgi:hypothetical protein
MRRGAKVVVILYLCAALGVIERELALLTPEVRGSADQLEELLDPDFAEIGKSGRLWTR